MRTRPDATAALPAPSRPNVATGAPAPVGTASPEGRFCDRRSRLRRIPDGLTRRTLPIHRATHTHRSPLKNMGVDHGRRDVAMAEQLLHRPNVIAVLMMPLELAARSIAVNPRRREHK